VYRLYPGCCVTCSRCGPTERRPRTVAHPSWPLPRALAGVSRGVFARRTPAPRCCALGCAWACGVDRRCHPASPPAVAARATRGVGVDHRPVSACVTRACCVARARLKLCRLRWLLFVASFCFFFLMFCIFPVAFLLFLVVVVQAIFKVAFLIAERTLYLPSLGFSILFADEVAAVCGLTHPSPDTTCRTPQPLSKTAAPSAVAAAGSRASTSSGGSVSKKGKKPGHVSRRRKQVATGGPSADGPRATAAPWRFSRLLFVALVGAVCLAYVLLCPVSPPPLPVRSPMVEHRYPFFCLSRSLARSLFVARRFLAKVVTRNRDWAGESAIVSSGVVQKPMNGMTLYVGCYCFRCVPWYRVPCRTDGVRSFVWRWQVWRGVGSCVGW